MTRARLIIYWDYELQIPEDVPTTPSLRRNGKRSYENTEYILDVLKEHDIKTCFCVVGYHAQEGELPYHAPDQIRRMAREGHEVGSHGHTHRDITLLGKKELYKEFRDSKQAIEHITAEACVSFAPPRNMPMRILWKDVSLAKGYRPNIQKRSLREIMQLLEKAGYETFRHYHRLIRPRLLQPRQRGRMTIYPLILPDNFDIAGHWLRKAIDEGKDLVVYSHPKALGRREKRDSFERFIRFAQEQRQKGLLSIALPRDGTP